MNRKIELDFLRGIAIILVLLVHFNKIIPFGWIGVDLFFVLSGYLISNLLFTEFNSKGKVNIKRFLIRRGFKLYPLFYAFIIITVISKILLNESVSWKIALYESTFTRNYFGGFWAHTWSLCVEEHFYIIFSFLIYMLCNKTNFIYNVKKLNRVFVFIFAASLILRILSLMIELKFGENHFFNGWARYSHTHHRIDSLLFGVCISYNLFFNKENSILFYQKSKKILLFLSIIFTIPVIIFANNDPFRTTLAFTLLYISSGILLIHLLINESMFNEIKVKWLNHIVGFIAFVGYNSYAIYLFHPFVRDYIIGNSNYLNKLDVYIQFVVYILLSLIIGYLSTKYIENYFLRLREKVIK
jgi:peptidoglycan/LPS O-acetylase OafA/YrhL